MESMRYKSVIFLSSRCATHFPGSRADAPSSSMEHGGAQHDGMDL